MEKTRSKSGMRSGSGAESKSGMGTVNGTASGTVSGAAIGSGSGTGTEIEPESDLRNKRPCPPMNIHANAIIIDGVEVHLEELPECMNCYNACAFKVRYLDDEDKVVKKCRKEFVSCEA